MGGEGKGVEEREVLSSNHQSAKCIKASEYEALNSSIRGEVFLVLLDHNVRVRVCLPLK